MQLHWACTNNGLWHNQGQVCWATAIISPFRVCSCSSRTPADYSIKVELSILVMEVGRLQTLLAAWRCELERQTHGLVKNQTSQHVRRETGSRPLRASRSSLSAWPGTGLSPRRADPQGNRLGYPAADESYRPSLDANERHRLLTLRHCHGGKLCLGQPAIWGKLSFDRLSAYS